MKYIINNIILPIDAPPTEALDAAKKLAGGGFACSIYKKSLDARKRTRPLFVYSVLVEDDTDRCDDAFMRRTGATVLAEGRVDFTPAEKKQVGRVGVVGFGPAGMFASLLLAENNYSPVIFERGDDIARRAEAVDAFCRDGRLDCESNIQFGAGGAGTFSDGKLVTRINDPLCGYVLKRLRQFGAPDDILTSAKPHIGTDVLRGVVSGITSAVRQAGGELRFRTRVTDIEQYGDGVRLTTSDSDSIYLDSCILAVGHSARDTYDMLLRRGVALEPKAFSVGLRIEHLQQDIDRGLYGSLIEKYKNLLPRGEYALSSHINGRGVYTFCMCPGGVVVPASSEPGGVCTNGMSSRARDGVNANAAVAVSVTPSDCGGRVLDGVELQRRLERAAFAAGGGNYYAPVQTVGSFLEGSGGGQVRRVKPSYMDGKYSVCDLRGILPGFVTDTLCAGIRAFGQRLPGFDSSDAVLTGTETRTSSPVRITRGAEMTSVSMSRLYPCGEGAGYAGGIMSAAVDGIKAAVKIMSEK